MKFAELDYQSFREGFDSAFTGKPHKGIGPYSIQSYGHAFGCRVIMSIKPDWEYGTFSGCTADEITLKLRAVANGEILLASPVEVISELNANDAAAIDFLVMLPTTSPEQRANLLASKGKPSALTTSIAEEVASDRQEKYAFDRDAAKAILSRL
jgi:hypothetical protein